MPILSKAASSDVDLLFKEAAIDCPDARSSELNWPKISIVIPNYNYGHFLEQTLRSVLLQNYPNLELIVIDGGSSDNSIEIIRKYSNWISYWVSEEDRGQAHAINKGFKQATGEVFAWLNSSDLYCPGALKSVGEIFRTQQQVRWITSYLPGLLWDDERITYTPHRKGYSRRFFMAGGYLSTAPYSLGCLQQESTFWRSDLWHQAGSGLSEQVTAALDFELWARFFEFTNPFGVNQTLSLFRVHAGQVSEEQKLIYVEEGLRVLGYGSDRRPPVAKIFNYYKRFGLDKAIGWESLSGLLYGETLNFLQRGPDQEWKVIKMSRLRLNSKGV